LITIDLASYRQSLGLKRFYLRNQRHVRGKPWIACEEPDN
jgi:hypothetical protein